MVSCAVNRTAWSEHPFREDLQYAEDDEWSRRLKAHGWKVKFAERSAAIHSHNYTLAEAYRRSRGDSFALAAVTPLYRPAPGAWLFGGLRDALRDLRWCGKHGRLSEWPRALGVRLAQRLGKLRGLQAGWAHYQVAPPARAAGAARPALHPRHPSNHLA